MNQAVKFNYIELKKLISNKNNDIKKYLRYVNRLSSQIASLEELINQNDLNNQNWLIHVPIEFIEHPFKTEKDETTKPLKWKKIVLQTITQNAMPMTTDLIYHKASQNIELPDRRFAIKNLSAALSALSNDYILYKIKIPNRRDYLYGFPYCFDEKGKLKSEYYSKFKLENEGK